MTRSAASLTTAELCAMLRGHRPVDGPTIQEACAEAARRMEAREWRDISTAPKDGTHIIAWCRHPNWQYAKTDGERAGWECPVIAYWTDFNRGGWTWHGMSGTFTKWQPLPEPSAHPANPSGRSGVENPESVAKGESE